ncbi:MAG: hypothetical protein M1823_006441, partial [Watsoniomyces obsoletus]
MDIESKYAIPSPESFAGGSIADFRRFERSCEIVFDTRPTHYEDDRRKILFAPGYLRGAPSDAWARLQASDKQPIVEWTAFKDWLRNETQPDGMRKMEASRRFREASQQTRQRVAEFVTYLDGLEEDMEELAEHDRKDALLMWLRPEIKIKIMETLPPPTTRQQVADLAIQIEEARNQATRAIGGERAHTDSGPRAYRQRTDRGRPIAPSRPLPMRETTRPPYPSANEPPRGPRGQGKGRSESSPRSTSTRQQDDGGAEINIIPQLLVKELGLECDTTTRPPIQPISGHALTVYGTTKVRFSIADADGRRLDCEEVFVTAKIAGHNMVLGDPWLARHDPDISHRTRTWRVRNDGEPTAESTPAKLNDIRFVKAMKFKKEASRRGAVAFAA